MESRERIIDLYKRNYSQREVAEKIGTSKWEVRKVVESENISRDRSKACEKRMIREPVPLRHDKDMYECWWDQTGQQRGEKASVVGHHRLLAIAEHGLDAVKDKEIHHQNTIPWDNRPENLKPVSPEEHKEIHRNGEWVIKDNEPKLVRTQRAIFERATEKSEMDL